MENLNKLSYTQFKVNEKSIYIPMEKIEQQYDNKRFANKPYLFKILYIGKYNKKLGEYTTYLAPLEISNLPIIKASIPLELIRTCKLIPNYDYIRPLNESELFIVNERVFRKIDAINKKSYNGYNTGYFLLCYGYLINEYKDDNAITTLEEGLQQFRLITDCPKKFKDRNYETSCFVTNDLDKIFKIYNKLPNIDQFRKFKNLPNNFFIDSK